MNRRHLALAAAGAAVLMLAGCSSTEPQSLEMTADPSASAPTQSAAAERVTLEDVWADLGCDGSTVGQAQASGDYVQRAGTCRLTDDASTVYFFEFESEPALNTGVIMDLEVGEGEALFSTENVAMIATDAKSAAQLATTYEAITLP